MATTCKECSQMFCLEDALCDDWKDPNKSFGCPHCGTFYYKDMRPDYRNSTKSGIFAGGILVPASMTLGVGISTDQLQLVFLGSCIVLSTLVIIFMDSVNLFGPLKKSEHRRNINA